MRTRALLVMTVLFSVSFVGRLAVMASDMAGQSSNDGPSTAQSAQDDALQCVSAELADTIKERIAALDEREKTIADRNAELRAYERQVERRLAELEKANAMLKSNVEQRQSAKDADIAKLAAIYEGMKPQQAGEIINEMNPEFAAGLLASMNSASAAQIVGTMDSKKAYMVSVLMANRTRGE